MYAHSINSLTRVSRGTAPKIYWLDISSYMHFKQANSSEKVTSQWEFRNWFQVVGSSSLTTVLDTYRVKKAVTCKYHCQKYYIGREGRSHSSSVYNKTTTILCIWPANLSTVAQLIEFSVQVQWLPTRH